MWKFDRNASNGSRDASAKPRFAECYSRPVDYETTSVKSHLEILIVFRHEFKRLGDQSGIGVYGLERMRRDFVLTKLLTKTDRVIKIPTACGN